MGIRQSQGGVNQGGRNLHDKLPPGEMAAEEGEDASGTCGSRIAGCPPTGDGGRDFDRRDACQINRIGLASSGETANPGRAGFSNVAFDDGT
jgi:hypothetical protein